MGMLGMKLVTTQHMAMVADTMDIRIVEDTFGNRTIDDRITTLVEDTFGNRTIVTTVATFDDRITTLVEDTFGNRTIALTKVATIHAMTITVIAKPQQNSLTFERQQ